MPPTKATITVFDEYTRPFSILVVGYDGGYNFTGERIQRFLKGATIVGNQHGLYKLPANQFESMGELAAKLIGKLTKDVIAGGYALCNFPVSPEYNYDIRYVPQNTHNIARVSFTGFNWGETKKFALYPEDEKPVILRRVQFVYGETTRNNTKWRTLDVTEEDATYLKGLEVPSGDFKNFIKSKIVGGKIFPA